MSTILQAVKVGIVAALFALTVFLGASVLAADRQARGERQVPQCVEDAVLIGKGDFENGRWTGYECGPAVDDYQQPGIWVRLP